MASPSHRRIPILLRLFWFTNAVTVLVLFAGCVVSGPSRQQAESTASRASGEAAAQSHRDQAAENRDTLAKTLRSYAIVTDAKKPRLDIHMFGIPGAESLNRTVELTVLREIKAAGGFGKHRAFDPVATAPVHRWSSTAFTEPRSASANKAKTGAAAGSGESATQDSDSDAAPPNTLEFDNSVLAAGGRYLVTESRLSGAKEATTRQLTDLHDDTTVDASKMFSSDIDVDTVAYDDAGAFTVDDDAVADDEYSALGKKVLAALQKPLDLPRNIDDRSPDFSCELLPCVALTYDDGPGDEKTENRLLAAADKAHVKLTYFFLGRSADHSPERVERIAAAGHEVDNHTYTHVRLDQTAPKAVKKQLRNTDKALRSAGQEGPFLTRPPYGALNKAGAHAIGGPAIIWDVDTGDWQHKNPKKTVQRVKTETRPGSVVLMHSIHPTTVDAAPKVFKTVADKGLYAVTVRELFDGIPWEKGGSYFCRGYADELCSNPEHPSVQKN